MPKIGALSFLPIRSSMPPRLFALYRTQCFDTPSARRPESARTASVAAAPQQPAPLLAAMQGSTVVTLSSRDFVFALFATGVASVCGCMSLFMLVMAPMLKAQPSSSPPQPVPRTLPASTSQTAAHLYAVPLSPLPTRPRL